MDSPPKFELGNISPNVSVTHAAIRVMSDSDDPNQEVRLQGHIKNVSEFTIENVKCDLSYFDANDRFLGLDISTFTQLDDIDTGETAPFDMDLEVPIEATRCVLNVHSKRVLQDIGVALQGYVSKTQTKT